MRMFDKYVVALLGSCTYAEGIGEPFLVKTPTVSIGFTLRLQAQELEHSIHCQLNQGIGLREEYVPLDLSIYND